jgi:hypothetical protein
MDEKHDFYNG